jgi:hypothetical protein
MSTSFSFACEQSLRYVWSPRMVLSVNAAPLAAAAAREAQLAFKPELASEVPREEARYAMQKQIVLSKSETSSALELAHWPQVFVSRGTSTNPKPIIGAMPQEAWQALIALRLAELPSCD